VSSEKEISGYFEEMKIVSLDYWEISLPGDFLLFT
jgi:hypothetical protein